MYLKCHVRKKDGKEHHYYSLAEKISCAGRRQVERHVLYLGEINDAQIASWQQTIDVFSPPELPQDSLPLYQPSPAAAATPAAPAVSVRLSEFQIRRVRSWGPCWAFTLLWEQLRLDEFWRERLLDSREHTSWYHVLMVLCAYRWIDPGSEWRLHREWYEQSAMGDLLGEDFSVVAKDTLYRCLDKLLEHKNPLFNFLKKRWEDLFGIQFNVLLYDLTSTYFESDPPFPDSDKRQFGYSRDKRSDCVQVVIALIVSVEGFPMAYEVMAGNTSDKTTLKAFLEKIQQQYGKAERIWVMDRGIPTEETLQEMRTSDPAVQYVVGTPRSKLSALEEALLKLEWQEVRPSVRVKLLDQEGELYVQVRSQARVGKDRAIRQGKLKKLWHRLKELKEQCPSYETLLLKLGGAKADAGRAWSLVEVTLPKMPKTKKGRQRRAEGFDFKLNRDKLRDVRRREGHYLLRTNLREKDGRSIWEYYLQLVEVEEAFKNLKGDLSIRPIYHQLERRIEAHIFVSFLAYSVHVTLRQHLRHHAPGLTVRQVLAKLDHIQMMDVHFPTTDGQELIFRRYSQPEKEQQMLLSRLNWTLPPQAPPRVTAKIGSENSYRLS